jgi:photosystem II stability/assembly factor-like uncharacterized protein
MRHSIAIFPILILAFVGNNLANNAWTCNGPEGGVVLDITVNPADSNQVFAATRDGVLFKTEDFLSWTAVNIRMIRPSPYEGISGITFDVCTPNKLYFWGRSGVFKSDDKGLSWLKIMQLFSGDVITFVQSPDAPDVMYAGIRFGYMGTLFHNYFGVVRTIDGGQTWQQLTDTHFPDKNILNVKLSPFNPNILYAATETAGIYMFDDKFDQWHDKSGNIGCKKTINIAMDSLRQGTLYVGTQNGLYKTVNRGDDWKDITGQLFKSRFINLNGLCLAGSEQNILFAGTNAGLYKSVDAGESWEEKNSDFESFNVMSVESNNSTVYAGTIEGIYKSQDGGDTWSRMVNGMMALDNKKVAFDTRSCPSYVYSISDAGLHLTQDSGRSWQLKAPHKRVYSLYAITINPLNPDVIYVGYIDGQDSLGQNINGVLKSCDGGETWGDVSGVTAGLFPRELAMNPMDTSVVYLSMKDGGLFRSNNSGKAWESLTEDLPTEYQVNTIRVDPQNPDVIYIGVLCPDLDRVGLYRSIDRGDTWQHLKRGFLTPDPIYVIDMAINPHNSNTLYIVNHLGLWKSCDAGLHWTLYHKDLFIDNNQLLSVCIDPSDTNRIYLAGTRIYQSNDGGETVEEMMKGLPDYYGYINQIRVDPNDPDYVYAAAGASGVWVYHRTQSGLQPVTEKSPTGFHLAQNHPNPFNPSTFIEFEIARSHPVQLKIFNARGQLIRTLLDEQLQAGSHRIQWNGCDDEGNNVASGVYFYQLQAGINTQTRKMMLLQ